jgi:DNA-binding CsgD family transcriptional regulator
MGIDADRLVDDIYEASFIPELWPNMLDRISSLSDMIGGVLFAAGRDGVKWLATDSVDPVMKGFVEQGWISRNSRASRAFAMGYPGFVNDQDMYSEEELAVEPMYVEYFRPLGLGWAAGTVIPAPSGDLIVFDFEQRFEKGPISRQVLAQLDEFRPHLARSALTSARLGLERARSAVVAFNQIGLPAAIVTRTARVVAANTLLEAMKEQVRFLARDRISFVSKQSQILLTQGLDQCGRNRKATLSIALPALEEARPAVAHIIPLQGRSHDIFASGDAVLLITPLTKPSMPQADILAGLFDLTPAEAKVARAAAGGLTAEAMARASALSPETVRTQIKAVLAKTGARRMVELSALLASTGAIGFT